MPQLPNKPLRPTWMPTAEQLEHMEQMAEIRRQGREARAEAARRIGGMPEETLVNAPDVAVSG